MPGRTPHSFCKKSSQMALRTKMSMSTCIPNLRDATQDSNTRSTYMNPDARKDPTLFLQKELADGASYKNEYVYLYTELEGRYSGLEHKEYLRALESGEKSFGGARENLLEEIRRDFAAKFDSPDKVRALLDERSVRYIIWDTSRYGAWDLGALCPIEQIASSGTLVLYRRAGP